jgi:hypothetical protein
MKIYEITNPACKEIISDLLRKEIGAGKTYSVDTAANALDIDARALRSYVNGENLPPMTVLLKMMFLFPTSFANRILKIASLDGAYRLEPEETSDFELNGDICKLVGHLGNALRDGRIDHRERPKIADEIRALIGEAQSWLNINDPILANDQRT